MILNNSKPYNCTREKAMGLKSKGTEKGHQKKVEIELGMSIWSCHTNWITENSIAASGPAVDWILLVKWGKRNNLNDVLIFELIYQWMIVCVWSKLNYWQLIFHLFCTNLNSSPQEISMLYRLVLAQILV